MGVEGRVSVYYLIVHPCLLTYPRSYQGRITNQLRRLGGSYDWNRVAFTMDEVRHLEENSGYLMLRLI